MRLRIARVAQIVVVVAMCGTIERTIAKTDGEPWRLFNGTDNLAGALSARHCASPVKNVSVQMGTKIAAADIEPTATTRFANEAKGLSGQAAQSQGPIQPFKVPAPIKKKADEPIKVDVNLALVTVTVTDPENHLVTGLDKSDFRVLENGVPQQIATFSSQDTPISIGVIFDMSGSMSDKADKAKQAAAEFFKTANPQDEFFLVSFNDRAMLTSSFTSDVEELQNSMMYLNPKGSTALLDAVYLGLSQMANAHQGKRALLVISDGGDNHSRYSEADVRSLLKESDCQLYAMGIFDSGDMERTTEERYGPTLLSELAEMSGGRVFSVSNVGDLPDIAAKIGMELRNQYVLGYNPSDSRHDGAWRKIKVQTTQLKGLPPFRVYAKTGYYAPKQ